MTGEVYRGLWRTDYLAAVGVFAFSTSSAPVCAPQSGVKFAAYPKLVILSASEGTCWLRVASLNKLFCN